jgi:t-SNARE complex subunit (syntaxin)
MDAPGVAEVGRARLDVIRAETDVREAKMNLADAVRTARVSRVRRFVECLKRFKSGEPQS